MTTYYMTSVTVPSATGSISVEVGNSQEGDQVVSAVVISAAAGATVGESINASGLYTVPTFLGGPTAGNFVAFNFEGNSVSNVVVLLLMSRG